MTRYATFPLVTLLCWIAGQLSAAAATPNVLYILCDDIRPDSIGCYGSQAVKTPHIDSLAASGVRFDNAFCTTSLCSPSRASLLTGLYAHAHGVTNNFTELSESLATFPRRLKDAGYATAYIGKWHMGENNDQPRPGFDYFVTHRGQGKYFDTEFNLNGRERKVVPGYYTTVVTDMALDWLRQRRPGQPWLMCLGHKATHSFYTPEWKYEHVFDAVDVQYPRSAFMLDDKPAWIRERLTTWHGIYGPLFSFRKSFPDASPTGVKDFAAMTRSYWATALSVDDSVGRLLDFLKTTGQLDNTLILFLGDNGLLNGEDGMVDKRTMHEPSIRIPLIVRYPGLTTEPRVRTEQVLTVDLAPSVLELCGCAPLTGIQGRSWASLARAGGDPNWRKSWFYEYNYEREFPFTPNVRGVRTKDWKYMRYPPGDGSPDRQLAELYDLANDPGELKNLAADPQFSSQLAAMQAELARAMAAVGLTPATDKMPLDEGVKQVLPDQKIR
jgi:N-acetylglucosamine-6-sulfatase